jgi:hypothetical protein
MRLRQTFLRQIFLLRQAFAVASAALTDRAGSL